MLKSNGGMQTAILTVSWVFSVSGVEYLDNTSIRPQSLSSKSVPVHLISYHSKPYSLGTDNVVE
jgi:hypothetical protein